METLNEALKIAALDIAQAAGDQLESDEEDLGDVDDFGAEPPAEAPPQESKRAPTTIFVNEDGTFTVKDKAKR